MVQLTRTSAGREADSPLSYLTADEDEDNLSNESDFADDDLSPPFMYSTSRSRAGAAGGVNKCDWCSRMSTIGELTLVTQDKVSKSFCSEDCQDLYRHEVLRTKICEWCKRHFPNEPSLIVVEPSSEAVPLQFCTQSCINKYKMELFCAEVKEQLRRIKEENLQLPNIGGSKSGHQRKILITPELWSEGESALVFVKGDPLNRSQNEASNNTKSAECETSDRKRKGHSMENVISKLSRRSHRYTINSPEEPCTYALPPENQTTPINLTVQTTDVQVSKQREHNFQPNTTTAPPPPETSSKPIQAVANFQQAKSWNSSMILPIPILIPVPIPIPIPMQAAPSPSQKEPASSQERNQTSHYKQEHTTPSMPWRTPFRQTPFSSRSVINTGKRYVLKKQLTSDDPE